MEKNIAYELNDDEIIQEEDTMRKGSLNYDINSYEFEDLDLAIAVRRQSKKDQKIIILYLMGYSHEDIGKTFNLTRSTISKRFQVIMEKLSRYL